VCYGIRELLAASSSFWADEKRITSNW